MDSLIAYGFLAHWAGSRWPQRRTTIFVTTIVLVATIGYARVYLGVHWVSDVGAGITAGLLWVTITTVAYETFRRIYLIRTLRAGDLQTAASSRRATRGE